MKMYHTATQKAYDELMLDLEEKGYKWLSGHKPTSLGNWESMKENTCIEISDKYITYGPLEQLKKQHQNTPVIEYKEKGENMKIYHTETREDYYSLMSELEGKGCEWMSGEKPTQSDNFRIHGKDTYFYDKCGVISLSDGDYFNKHYKDEPIIEYKSKGDNQMANKECNQCHKKWHQDSAKYCSWCGNKLVDEPKFKVGDYVSDTLHDDPFICKIEEFEGHNLVGNWYCLDDNHLDKSTGLHISKCRLSTPEEIAEYEIALNFYKHGRDPFEIKEGDILSDSETNIFFVNEDIEIWNKEDFISGDFTLLKTAEEVDEWLGAEDE